MDRHNYYFGEYVTEQELDDGFDYSEQADWDQFDDVGLTGISVPSYDVAGSPPSPPDFSGTKSWTAVENTPTEDWNVIVTTGYAHDKNGKRLAVDPPTTVLVDCEEDYLGVDNSVTPSSGNTRWISLFLHYTKVFSDPRLDDDGATVYFDEAESYTIWVKQGAEAGSPVRPPVESEDILICDILIAEATEGAGIQDADIDYTRAEFLVNLDLAAIWSGSEHLYGRNMEETLYNLISLLKTTHDSRYLRRGGQNTITGNIQPDTADSRSLGNSARFLLISAARYFEAPSEASTASKIQPQNDWDTGGGGHIQAVKEYMDYEGYVRRFMDVRGREHQDYYEEIEDFNYRNGWPGTIGTDTTWRQTLTAGGTTDFNPTAYSQRLEGGFIEVDCSAAAGDEVEIFRGAYPGKARSLFMMEWATYVEAVSGGDRLFWGFIGTGGWNYTGFVYDPGGTWNPGGPNSNIWCVHDDGTNTAVWVDSGITMANFDDTLRLLTVAFEVDGTGDLLLRWYIDREEETEFNLTDGGGTYGTKAEGESYDLDFQAYENSAGPALVLLLDYYRMTQMRRTWAT